MHETAFGPLWRAIDPIYDVVLGVRRLQCIVCALTGKRGDFGLLHDQCLFGGGKLERYQCPRCDTVFGPMKFLDLPDAVIAADYRTLYARYSEADSTGTEIAAFHAMSPRRDGRYLNWGAGAWSHSVESLRADGWNVDGFEPHASTHSHKARAHLADSYDGIFSNNVIEHLRDPLSQFAEFAALLAEGGVMAHASPCYEYCYAYTRFHTYFPIGRSAETLARQSGFKLVERTETQSETVICSFARITP